MEKKYLIIEELLKMYRDIQDADLLLEKVLFKQYKTIDVFIHSQSFTGKWAKSFKSFLQEVDCYIISEALDISYELLEATRQLVREYAYYETDSKGRIKTDSVDMLSQDLISVSKKFNQMDNRIASVRSKSSIYITTHNDDSSNIADYLVNISKYIAGIIKHIDAIDNAHYKQLFAILQREQKLRNFIAHVSGKCFKNGELQYTYIPSISSEPWYKKNRNNYEPVRIRELICADNYYYYSDRKSRADKQLPKGLSPTVFAVLYSRFASHTHSDSRDGNTYVIKSHYSLGELDSTAQASDYIKQKDTLRAAYWDIDAKSGLSYQYAGVHLKVNGGVLNANQKQELGTEEANAYVKANANFLTAEGEIAMEYDFKKGEGKFGIDLNGDVVNADVKGGLSILKYKSEYTDPYTGEKEKRNLLAFKAKPSGGVEGGGKLMVETNKVTSVGPVQLNATTLDLGLKKMFGLDVSLTVPTLTLKPIDLSDKYLTHISRNDLETETSYVRYNHVLWGE